MMMDHNHNLGKCPDANVLAAYMARTLTGNARTEFEAHLQHCDACRDACEAVESLFAEPLDVVPPEVLAAARQLAPQPTAAVQRANFGACVGSWAAVVAVMALGGALGCFLGMQTAADPHLSGSGMGNLFGELGNPGNGVAMPRYPLDSGGVR